MKKTGVLAESKSHPGKLDTWSALVPVLFDLVCGLLLILWNDLALRLVAYVVSALLLGLAAWKIIAYFRSSTIDKITGTDLAVGLGLLTAGILLAFNPEYPRDILPFVWGLALLFGAFLKIQYAFDEKMVGIRRWWLLLILAAFSIAIGVISLLSPDFLGESRNLIIGIMLIVEAVVDFTVFLFISRALKKKGPPSVTVPLQEHPVPETPSESIPAESVSPEIDTAENE